MRGRRGGAGGPRQPARGGRLGLFRRRDRRAQFLREKAWPVLSGVADWFVDRVTRTRDGFDLLRAADLRNAPGRTITTP